MAGPIVLDLNKNAPANILNLTKALPQLKKLKGMLNWDPSVTSANHDLDIFILCLNEQGKITSGADVVFFNNKFGPGVAVPVDNTSGAGDDDEYFTIEMAALSPDHFQWDIFVFIHDAAKLGQTFGQIKNAKFEILNDETGESMVHYQITQTFVNETALHVASLVRLADGSFELQPVGQAGEMNPNEVAGSYM